MNECEATTGILEDSDTIALEFRVEDEVCCVVGELNGLRGVLVANRAGGRVLVRIANGLYVELPRSCVRKDEA